MSILIDGDACPDVGKIKDIALLYRVEMTVFIDYAHAIYDDYFKTVVCETGNDSVDLTLLKYIKVNDIVITQDYGLASLALSKGAQILHVSGKVIDDDNIDRLLLSRFIFAKERKKGKHLKGPPKRTIEDRKYFIKQLKRMLSAK